MKILIKTVEILLLTIWFSVGINSVLLAESLKPNVVQKLGLKETTVQGATVYYEPCFEEKLDDFKSAYQGYRVQTSNRPESPKIPMTTLVSKKTEIIDDICQIVGGDNELKTKLMAVLEGFINSTPSISMPLAGTDNVIYLILQSTTKDYLRSGGSLPNLLYDKETDTAEYRLYFGSNTNNASNQEILLPIPSVDEIESVSKMIFSNIPSTIEEAPEGREFIVIHEISEAAIVNRLKSGDPHNRWFTDGFANAITYEILCHHYSQEDADTFLEGYSTTPYEEIKNTINLQHWMSAQFTFRNKWPLKKEQDYTYARYCFATEEARRIIKEYGVECIKKILETYVANSEKKAGAILMAIQQATGDNIQEHLAQYQTYKSPKEGFAHYFNELKQAKGNSDTQAAIFAMLRMLDLCDQPFSKNSLNLRKSIAVHLYYEGHKELAIQSITEFADSMCLSKDQNNHYVGQHLVILYALEIQQPEIAAGYAKKTLENIPDDVYALTIIMHQANADKDFEKAHEYAQKICNLMSDTTHPCHKAAKQILARQEK